MNKQDVEKILEDKVRPQLAADGGGVDLVELKDDNTVVVKLTGACGCCPFSQMTLKAGVEKILRDHLPDIKEVVSV